MLRKKLLIILLLIVGCEEIGLNTEQISDGTAVADTLYISNYDTLIITNYDTLFINNNDTLIITNYDTTIVFDTLIITNNDTTFVFDTLNINIEPSYSTCLLHNGDGVQLCIDGLNEPECYGYYSFDTLQVNIEATIWSSTSSCDNFGHSSVIDLCIDSNDLLMDTTHCDLNWYCSGSCDSLLIVVEVIVGPVEEIISVFGCMNEDNANYNSAATTHVADSCAVQIYGCTDSTALNYIPSATNMCVGITTDQCCTEKVSGCTDSNYENYNENANSDDGSCAGAVVFGCMSDSACNYNPIATRDCSNTNAEVSGTDWIQNDACCSYANEGCECSDGGGAVADNCGVCNTDLSNDCVPDCAGVWGGTAVDDCNGICGGSSTLYNDGSCCDVGYTGLNQYCYYQSDLDVLQDFIDLNEWLTGEPHLLMNDGGEGTEHLWNEGRLYYLFFDDGGGNNFLTLIPESIGNLDSLEQLNMAGHALTSLPDGIGNLSNLKRLRLNSNKLTSLPEVIGNLSSLMNLYLSNNQLTSLPENIGSLSSLKYLSVDSNQLTSLPNSIGDLSSLKNIYLGENQFTSLPESICDIFPNLTTFDVSGNKICGTLPSCLTASDIGSQDCPF